MDAINKMRFCFVIFWTLLLGIAIADGKTLAAVFDMAFIAFNLFRLYQAYEEGSL